MSKFLARVLTGVLMLQAISAFAQKAQPNIVVILADDMGYSDIGCFGGEIQTPNLDELAERGLRFTQFYNTARCCSTRAALLTGLHQHQTGIGQMTESPQGPRKDDRPAYQGYLNRNCVTMAEVLKSAGYHTYMAGKWHLGYHGREKWPRQRGFEHFYGSLAGATSYFRPQGGRGLSLENEKQTSSPYDLRWAHGPSTDLEVNARTYPDSYRSIHRRQQVGPKTTVAPSYPRPVRAPGLRYKTVRCATDESINYAVERRIPMGSTTS